MTLRSLAAPVLAAVVAFAAYGATLAPTVTFEDSGELITAAHRLGIAHQPGYPLYTMVGHAVSRVPVGTVAWRLNLLSATCMSLGVLLLALTLQRCGSRLWPDPAADGPARRAWVGAAAVAGALLAAFAFETWEQAVITEVYGLHLAWFGLTLFWLARWTLDEIRRRGTFAGLGFTLGLAVSHHPAAVVWFPAVAAALLLTAPRAAIAPGNVLRGAAAFALGLLPLAYLPWASARDPVLDWGDPETLAGLVEVVTRHQYGGTPATTLAAIAQRIGTFGALTLEQWPPATLLLLVPGVLVLGRRLPRLLAILALLWLGTGPLMAVLANFDTATGDAFVDAEQRALVSVFFIPSYWVLAFVAGAGMIALAAFAAPRLPAIAAAALVLVPAATAAAHWNRVDLSRHRAAEAYVDSLFALAPPGALILVHWDPFYFPTLYFQHVEGWRPDLMVVDTALLRRSWYVRQLRRHHAGAVAVAEGPMLEFLEAVAPFERGRPYDGRVLEQRYQAMIRALIDGTHRAGREVFATDLPAGDAGSGLLAEPRYVAWRLSADDAPAGAAVVVPASLPQLLRPSNERMAEYVRGHVQALVLQRAQECAAAGGCADAEPLGRLLASFADPAPAAGSDQP